MSINIDFDVLIPLDTFYIINFLIERAITKAIYISVKTEDEVQFVARTTLVPDKCFVRSMWFWLLFAKWGET
jgi:hypothetical protein